MSVNFEETVVTPEVPAIPAVVKRIAVIKITQDEKGILDHLRMFDIGWKIFSICVSLCMFVYVGRSLLLKQEECVPVADGQNCEDLSGILLIAITFLLAYGLRVLSPAKAAKNTILKLKGWDGESEYRLEVAENQNP